ncbi:NAD-dependent epimerase/dehydratase family protein [Nakamurella multipartita]|uniref:NAD-dependent epimerase/dehydratase n=1 Tax=Nakamurella multipartita (strain ATCC 700099 / DSM 44233 / CIP 104796 / JCM 9543 / NBRC 105858 / Y-104) TaxID=479431 RepID=C8XIL2_NAKMY|nr:NAD-dependent epimerase/dehydratase family protein [Nakamurella multipartita]ACV80477.1 NAD-dependent epimerase/dehydratase [Nakamurella multipartita DSM 44233]
MAHVVVTGAGGYLGPHVVSAVLDRGHAVTAVVRPGSTIRLDDRAEVLEADVLRDGIDIPSRGSAGPVTVVHLAWRDGFHHNSPAHMAELSAHYQLLTELPNRGVARIIALGTMHEVGYWEGAIDADTPTQPLSQYGVAKDALRRSLELALPDSVGLVWARAFYIYGDDRRNRSIFARLLQAVDEGQTSLPFTSGKNRYDFIRVEELGRQLAALVDAEDVTGTLNCCTGRPVSLADKVMEFIRENDLPISLDYGAFPDRPYDSPGIWGDASRILDVVARDKVATS